MSIGPQIFTLWRRARPFRVTVFLALAATAAAVLSGSLPGGSTSQQIAQNNQNIPGGPGTPQAAPSPAPSSPASTSARCAAPGSGAQAPIVVGSNVPSNVKAVSVAPPAGMPLETESRFRKFQVQVNAATAEARMGESCALMSGALDLLQAIDYAYAECFAGGNDLLTKAQNCSQRHAQSETRFANLSSTFSAVAANRSAPQITALARARADMTPYDESREVWKQKAEQVAAGDVAQAAIKASDARISQLVQAASAATANGGFAETEALARAAGLDALDLPRLSPDQASLLEQARAARERINDSDRRLDRLAEAVELRRTSSKDSRGELIAAVSALTAMDTARAGPAQATMITSAKSEAAAFAMDDLLEETRTFNPQTAPASQFKRITDLADVVKGHGGITQPTGPQAQALAVAQDAVAALTRSNRRLESMSATAAAVKSGGPASLGNQVRKNYEDITQFDISRMTDRQRQDYDSLKAAREVTLATEAKTFSRSIPLFVGADGNHPQMAKALAALKSVLTEIGFRIVEAEEQSAVRLKLNVGEARTTKLSTGSASFDSVRQPMTMTGDWTFASDKLKPLSVQGVGNGQNARDNAFNEAIKKLAEGVRNLADGT